MPSTPVDSPFDEIGDMNSPDRSQVPSLFLRHQQIKNVYTTAEVLENQQTQRLHNKSFKMLNIATPDSDHSSDHDISPKIQRRRKNLIAAAAEDRLNLPKLSISVDHDSHHHHHHHHQYLHNRHSDSRPQSQMLSSSSAEVSKISHDNSKRVMKSASAVDLSLKISPHSIDITGDSNIRKDRTRLKLDTNLYEHNFKPIESDTNLECDTASSKIPNNGGSSTASSREVSPSREGPSITNLKPP